MAVDEDELTREASAADGGAPSSPLEAFAASTRALAEASSAAAAFRAIAAAAASATRADVALVRVLEQDGERLTTRGAWSASEALEAQLVGSHVPASQLPEGEADERGTLPRALHSFAERLGARAVLAVPARVDGRTIGTLELVRSAPTFSAEERAFARLAADQVALAIRAFEGNGVDATPLGRALELAGEALAAGTDQSRTAAELARVAAEASGARGSVLWLASEDDAAALAPTAVHGDVTPSRELRELAAAAAAGGFPRRAVPVPVDGASVATLELGQPPAPVLQLVFPPGAELPDDALAALAAFAVRASHALRASDRTRTLALELERTRTVLGVVAQANAQLSLSHTLETVVDSVAELLDVERVAVYLREEGRLLAAAGRGLEGPHAIVAERLLELALGPFRARGMLVVEDVRFDARLAGVRSELREDQIEAAVAAPLVVGDEVTGLLALYPVRGRKLVQNEAALLAALSAQLAVAVQNARLHEHATELGAELEDVLVLERQAARQLAALYEISRSFAQSLSLEATLDAVARTVVELLDVDAAVIRMPDARGETLVPRAGHVADVHLAEAVRTILDRPQSLERLPGRRLLRSGRPLVLDAESARRFGPAHDVLVPFLEKGSTAVVLPIATPAELLGTLTLLSLDPERPITEETAEIGVSVAAQAALALDNARLYQQQKEFADTMQRSLLPRSQPRLPGLEVGDVYESSAHVDVGGDVYDFVTLADGRLAVVLGDVTGHGIDAAADMAMAKFVFRSLARDHPEPARFLAVANDVVCGEIAPGKFITMAYLTIDPESGAVAAASAGHPLPRLVLPDGRVERVLTRGLALGIDPGQEYEEVRTALPEGASLVVFTDGVVEARRGGELYGDERLERLLAERRELPPTELALAVVEDCRRFSGGELADDCAIVVIRRTAAVA